MMIMLRLGPALILAALVTTSCGLCGEDVIQTAISPDKKYSATYLFRSCGATTSFVPIVRIARTGVAGIFREPKVLASIRDPTEGLEMRWTAKRELLIACPMCPPNHRFWIKEHAWEDVKVRYELGGASSIP